MASTGSEEIHIRCEVSIEGAPAHPRPRGHGGVGGVRGTHGVMQLEGRLDDAAAGLGLEFGTTPLLVLPGDFKSPL
jgi:hypothetical protein